MCKWAHFFNEEKCQVLGSEYQLCLLISERDKANVSMLSPILWWG